MAKTDFKSVDDYLSTLPPETQGVLAQVRLAIRHAMPDAEEVISYQIPAYRLNGKAILFFAGWKTHYSLYPLTDALLHAFNNELANYELAKGTIRFPLAEPVPLDLIEGIAKFRATEKMTRGNPKTAKSSL